MPAEISLYPRYSPVETEGNREQEKTILVVEDDAMLLEFVHDVLEMQGFKILLASNIQEALIYLEDKGQPIDLIFSDIRIPGGMDGIALVRKAKQLRTDLRVLLTSGFSQEMLEQPVQEEFQILQKPYYPDALAHAIYTALDIPNTQPNTQPKGREDKL